MTEFENRKIFCIGWHKTGTTTIGLALIKLGYSVLGCRLDMVHPLRRGDTDSVLELAGRFDAVQDVPWAALFRELDLRYPGSKFILTEREPEVWLSSAQRHFSEHDIPLHDWLYGKGKLKGNESIYLDRYKQHNSSVKNYFSDRADDLLILNFENGDGWEKLCLFLGLSVPSASFPHENKSSSKRTFTEKLYCGLRDSIPIGVRSALFECRMKIRSARGLPDPRNRFHNFLENRAERMKWKKEDINK